MDMVELAGDILKNTESWAVLLLDFTINGAVTILYIMWCTTRLMV